MKRYGKAAECAAIEAERGKGERTHGGILIRAPEIHRCSPPDASTQTIGTRFVCDCGRRHIVKDAQSYQGGRYWASDT